MRNDQSCNCYTRTLLRPTHFIVAGDLLRCAGFDSCMYYTCWMAGHDVSWCSLCGKCPDSPSLPTPHSHTTSRTSSWEVPTCSSASSGGPGYEQRTTVEVAQTRGQDGGRPVGLFQPPPQSPLVENVLLFSPAHRPQEGGGSSRRRREELTNGAWSGWEWLGGHTHRGTVQKRRTTKIECTNQ